MRNAVQGPEPGVWSRHALAYLSSAVGHREVSGNLGGPPQEPLRHQDTSPPTYPISSGTCGMPPQPSQCSSPETGAKSARMAVWSVLLVVAILVILLIIFT